MSEFNRQSPLFERSRIPFEVFYVGASRNNSSNGISCHATPNRNYTSQINSNRSLHGVDSHDLYNKKRSYYTLRILEGRRPISNQSTQASERAIRLEISDECSHFSSSSNRQNKSTEYHQPVTPQQTYNNQTPKPDYTHFGQPPVRMMQQIQPPSSNSYNSHQENSMLISSGPVCLYELEVGETDFSDLRRDLALLVDFPDFASSFISLLNFCDLGQNQENQNNINGQMFDNTMTPSNCQQFQHQNFSPMRSQQHLLYTCRLEIMSSPNSSSISSSSNLSYQKNSNNVRFSIVESNQFRELAHLSLTLQAGTDTTIRSYLSSRLIQTMNEKAILQTRLKEETNRANSAQESCQITNSKLQELSLTYETEKREMKVEANEEMMNQVLKSDQEHKALIEQKEKDLEVIRQEQEEKYAALQEKYSVIDGDKQKLTEVKYELESRVQKLENTLAIKEDNIQSLNNNLKALRSEVNKLQDENKLLERSLHQTQLNSTSLEKSNESQEKAIAQLEALRRSAEESSVRAQSSVDRQTQQISELKAQLMDSQVKSSKTAEILTKFQQDRIEMKKKMSGYVQIIEKQENIINSKQHEISSLNTQMERIQLDKERMKEESNKKNNEIQELNSKLDESKKVTESNQQVISWLNREVNDAQLGRTASYSTRPPFTNVQNRGISIPPVSNISSTSTPSKVNSYKPSSISSLNNSVQPPTMTKFHSKFDNRKDDYGSSLTSYITPELKNFSRAPKEALPSSIINKSSISKNPSNITNQNVS